MSEWPLVALGDVTSQRRDAVKVDRDKKYPLLGVRWYAQGAFHRETVTPKAGTIYRAQPGQFIYNRLFAWKGSFGLVTDGLAGSFVSNEFPLFSCDPDRLAPEYLALVFGRPEVWAEIERMSTGTTASRNRWNEPAFNAYRVALPSVAEQQRIIATMHAVNNQIERLSTELAAATTLTQKVADDGYESAMQSGASVSLGSLTTKIQNGVMYRRGDAEGGWPVTRIETISSGRIDLRRTGRAGFTDENAGKFVLAEGDILFSNKNSLERVGSTAIVRASDLPLINGDNILQLTADGVDANYLFAILRSSQVRAFIRSITRPAVNQASVNTGQVRAIEIPLPESEVQSRVGGAYASALSLCDHQISELTSLRAVRADLLTALLSQRITVDVVVDKFVKVA
jgi:type I restriction enzyme S subunit